MGGRLELVCDTLFDFINACTSSRIFNLVDVKEEADENACQTD